MSIINTIIFEYFSISIDKNNRIAHNMSKEQEIWSDHVMNIIKELRIRKGLTQAQLAQECEVHQTAVSQWEKGRTAPDTNSLKILSDIFGVSVDMILGIEEKPIAVKIPVLGYVRAGIPIEAVEDILDFEEISSQMASTGDFFALSVKGDSMQPRICEGDVVIVRKQDDVESGDIAVVLVDSESATVKKVIKKGKSVTLLPFNNVYDPMIFTESEIDSIPVKVLGKVVEVRCKF